LSHLAGFIDRGLDAVKVSQITIQEHVAEIIEVSAALDPASGPSDQRRVVFATLGDRLGAEVDPIRQQMAAVMRSFEPGLFVGGDEPDLPRDNLDLERWFRQPKGHERRIHGHRHAGVRIVQEGPTLLLALDAYLIPNRLDHYPFVGPISTKFSAYSTPSKDSDPGDLVSLGEFEREKKRRRPSGIVTRTNS
jgi:hypothetical protein